MPTYISLLSWTQQGIENIKDSPSRLQKAKKAISAAGGNMKSFYMTIGSCDMVCVVEAPNDATFATIMLALSAQGGIRSQTLKAFSEDEYKKIIRGLP